MLSLNLILKQCILQDIIVHIDYLNRGYLISMQGLLKYKNRKRNVLLNFIILHVHVYIATGCLTIIKDFVRVYS